jgi:hypothetical protein
MNNSLDWKFYISYYKDLNNITNEKDALNHWNKHGKNEKRFCNKEILNLYQNFDHIFYLNLYNDLKKAGIYDKMGCFYHWLNTGKNENRCINKDDYFNSIHFDYKFYISLYDDLYNINNENDAKEHWINYGMKEKRLHSTEHYEEYKNFDWISYIENHPELKDKNINNKNKAYIYYVNIINDKKNNNNKINNNNININKIKENFDWEFYKSYYKELNNINNYDEALNHYLNNGIHNYKLINKDELENYNIFDWEKYINYYKLGSDISNKEKAYFHWNKFGKQNGAIFFFNNNYKIENNVKIYDYSIIIYYDGDFNNIVNCLNNFNDLYYKKYSFEVIIIDNNSKNNLDNILDDYHFKIIYIYEHNNLLFKNIYQFYNKAVSYSNGKILIFQHSKIIHYDDLFYKLKLNKLIDNTYIFNTIDYDFNKNLLYSNNQNIIIDKSYILENNIEDYDLTINFINNYNNKNTIINYKYCICLNKYYFDILEGFDETYENEFYCFKDFLNRLNKLNNIKNYKSYIYTKDFDKNINNLNLTIDKLKYEQNNINLKWNTLENKIYKKINKKFGIAISVYSDKDTSYNRILTSKICLNSIIKNFRNVPIVIVIDHNIENNHLTYIKELIYNKKNIELYINKENFGIAKTKNICIKLLENKNIDYICLLDDDIEIIKDFSNYVINIFDNINIPLLTNYNNELSYDNIKLLNYNFIKTTNYFGNFLIINKIFIDKYGYFAKFEYKWGEEHVEITNRYLNNTKYKNTVLDLSKFIINEQIINGESTLHLHSLKIDLNLAQKNKITMENLLKDIKYIPFTFDTNEFEKIN